MVKIPTHAELAWFLYTRKIAFDHADLDTAVMYFRGPRTCEHYDALYSWAKMIVNEWEKQ